MSSESVVEIAKQVLTSWQVIAVTVGIIIYLNIVFYVARSYRTPRLGSIAKKIKFKRKSKSQDVISDEPEEIRGSNDELGLEED